MDMEKTSSLLMMEILNSVGQIALQNARNYTMEESISARHLHFYL
jgi:hypothetical protein